MFTAASVPAVDHNLYGCHECLTVHIQFIILLLDSFYSLNMKMEPQNMDALVLLVVLL